MEPPRPPRARAAPPQSSVVANAPAPRRPVASVSGAGRDFYFHPGRLFLPQHSSGGDAGSSQSRQYLPDAAPLPASRPDRESATTERDEPATRLAKSRSA